MYILTYAIFWILAGFEIFIKYNVATKKFFNSILFLFLVFQMGLRWETGTDWNSYLENFNQTFALDDILLNVLLGFEIGYGLFVLLFKQISNEYFLFLFFHATVFYFIIFRAFKEYAFFPILSILLFYSSTIGVLGSNRQLLSIAICLFSIRYIKKRNFKMFIFYISIAFLFHTSAILFTVAYFLNKDYNKYLIFILVAFSVLIGLTDLPIKFFNNLSPILGGAAKVKSDFYLDRVSDSSQSLSILGLIRRVIYFVIFSYSYKFISNRYVYYKLFYNLYTFGLVIYFVFSSSLLILVNRGSLYFNIMECFLLPSLLIFCQKKYERGIVLFLLFFISLLTFYQSISSYSDLFIPYKGIYINSEFSRKMY